MPSEKKIAIYRITYHNSRKNCCNDESQSYVRLMASAKVSQSRAKAKASGLLSTSLSFLHDDVTLHKSRRISKEELNTMLTVHPTC